MHFYVDIDNTLCVTNGAEYEAAQPIPDRISKVNQLYDAGHTITIYTARGSRSCLKKYLEKLTAIQLKEWGVKYHYLDLGNKPVYDYLIDDRNICLNQLDEDNPFEHFCR